VYSRPEADKTSAKKFHEGTVGIESAREFASKREGDLIHQLSLSTAPSIATPWGKDAG